MCPGESSGGSSTEGPSNAPTTDVPPDWRTIALPSPSTLRRLTDCHCHPTDMPFSEQDVRDVGLGGLVAMGTRVEDQGKVKVMGEENPALVDGGGSVLPERVRVVTAFGYHPWFSHLLTLDPSLSKTDHYRSIFPPTASLPSTLDNMLPNLPDPIPLLPLLQEMRKNIKEAKDNGRLVVLGEVGLDKSFRIPWPRDRRRSGDEDTVRVAEEEIIDVAITQPSRREQSKRTGDKQEADVQPARDTHLSPFQTSMTHQLAILEAQMDIALESGMPVSLHSVRAQGPTLDFLNRYKKKHGKHFTDRVNVDIHSCGGWSVDGWLAAEKTFPNLYLSPSLAITARSPLAPGLIRAAHMDRILVESDTHLIRDVTRRVWGAAVWIAGCRDWDWDGREEGSQGGNGGAEGGDRIDVVDVLEANWKRFMRLPV